MFWAKKSFKIQLHSSSASCLSMNFITHSKLDMNQSPSLKDKILPKNKKNASSLGCSPQVSYNIDAVSNMPSR